MILERESKRLVWAAMGLEDETEIPTWLIAYIGVAITLIVGLVGFCLIYA